MGYLDVGDGHTIYYEQHGTGKPVVVLHGGPGGGLQRSALRYFDLKRWRVTLFDQRGCGRSTPRLGLRSNTTWDLVADIERLREHVGVDRWTVFGGSWGSTLALAYASRYGNRVVRMILRGIYLGEASENDWLYKADGVSQLRPQEWAAFVRASGQPAGTRRSLVRPYQRRLRDRRTRRAAARAWWGWEAALSTLEPKPDRTPGPEAECLAVLENHYFAHHAWLRPGQLLAAARHMDFPVTIVQGRYDLVCPPISAVRLAAELPKCRLILTQAGHAASDPATAKELRRATDEAV